MQFVNQSGVVDAQLGQLLFVASNQNEQTAATVLTANRAGVNQMLLQLFLSFQFQSPQNKELVESEKDPRRLAQRLTGSFFLTNEGNEISFYDSISNDSWFNIFSFLATPDFYFYHKNDKHQTSLHCVSKWFNTLIIGFFAQTNKLIGRQRLLTVREVSTTLTCDKDHELQCMLQFPNGLNHAVTVRKFPEISGYVADGKYTISNIDTPVEFNITQSNKLISIPFDKNSIKIVFDESDFRDKDLELITLKNSKSQPDVTQSRSRLRSLGSLGVLGALGSGVKKVGMDKMENRLTLFQLNLESLGHGTEIGDIDDDDLASYKAKLFGSGEVKVIDVNLQNMFNYYIYNEDNLKLFDEHDLDMYSIAQMAYYYSKRCWVTGIIDNRKLNGGSRLFDYYLTEFGKRQLKKNIERCLRQNMEIALTRHHIFEI